MSDEKHARRGAVRGEELVEERHVRLDLGGEFDVGRLGREGAFSSADVGRQAEVGVGKDGHGPEPEAGWRLGRRLGVGDGTAMDRVQEGHVHVEEPRVSWSSTTHNWGLE